MCFGPSLQERLAATPFSMRIPTFKEAVAIGNGSTIYVFPINSAVVFVWDKYLSEMDWGLWYMVDGGNAYKVVLWPYGPSASVGNINDNWDKVAKQLAVKIPPRVFFILSYISSSLDPEYLEEPKIVSIRDFNREKVRALAARLKSQLLDLIVRDAWG